jgi:DNA-binding transcriptional regulator YiaG
MPISKALPPVVQELLQWRTKNELSQSQAAQRLHAAGLAVSVRTLQNWEGGRNAPYSLASAALRDFLLKQGRNQEKALKNGGKKAREPSYGRASSG